MTPESRQSVDIVFEALSDQTRRDLLSDIVRRKANTATHLAADRQISHQAVSRHLAELSGIR